ncbi:MAG: hypothetical protein AAFX50_16575, partial [Acidobacteriota bacterium]
MVSEGQSGGGLARGLRPSVAVLALAVAGAVHLQIAPVHYDHAPAHGLFFGGLGVAQVLWAILGV